MKQESQEAVLIDEHNLDKECLRLPRDYLRFARLSANAKQDVDEGKRQLDLIESQLRHKVRSVPGTFGLKEKPTESAVSDTVLRQESYQLALTTLNQAKHKAELHQAVVWALEHKKRTLTLLVELHGMGYFSNPKVSKEGRDAVEELSKRKTRTNRLSRD